MACGLEPLPPAVRTRVLLVPGPHGASPPACCHHGLCRGQIYRVPITQECTVGWLRRGGQRWRLTREQSEAAVWQFLGIPLSSATSSPPPLTRLPPAQHPSPISHLLPRTVPLAGRGAILLTAHLGCFSGSSVPGPGLDTLNFTWALERSC